MATSFNIFYGGVERERERERERAKAKSAQRSQMPILLSRFFILCSRGSLPIMPRVPAPAIRPMKVLAGPPPPLPIEFCRAARAAFIWL